MPVKPLIGSNRYSILGGDLPVTRGGFSSRFTNPLAGKIRVSFAYSVLTTIFFNSAVGARWGRTIIKVVIICRPLSFYKLMTCPRRVLGASFPGGSKFPKRSGIGFVSGFLPCFTKPRTRPACLFQVPSRSRLSISFKVSFVATSGPFTASHPSGLGLKL